MKTFLKFATVVPVCFLTWLGTCALMAQQQRKNATNPPARGVNEMLQTDAGRSVVRDPGILRPQAAPGAHMPVSAHRIKAFDLVVQGGVVKVRARVSLRDIQGNNFYMWILRFLDVRGNLVDQVLYEHQIFGMDASGEMEPTFVENLGLIPNTSMVQLSLFAFPPNTDLAIFKDEEKSQGYLVLRRVTKL